jgi:uncharacterized protein YndB with AHSA1/START domain
MSTQTSAVTSPSLTLKRRLNAPPAKVFSAWTNPEQITRWFGPAEVETILAECDPRVGGRYRIVARSPDGAEHHVSGVYREVVPNEKLVFTWAWRNTPERESLVTVSLKGDGNGTVLMLTHERFSDETARDRHQHGWIGSLDKLEQLFA